MSTDGSTVGSDDEWETASGESTDEEAPVDIMDLAAEGGHATDDGAENVDREELQETRNKINEAISNTNPGKVLQ